MTNTDTLKQGSHLECHQ